MKVSICDKNHIDTLITLFKVLHNFSTNVVLDMNKERMYLQAMDQSQISILDYTIKREWFDSFDVKEDVSIGINTKILCMVFGCFIDGGTMDIELPKDSDVISITFKTETENAIVKEKEFSVPLIDIERDLLDIPDTEYSVDLTLQTSLYNDIINEIAKFSTILKMKLSEEEVTFKTGLGTNDITMIDCNFEVKLDIENMVEFSIEEDANIVSCYNIKYLTQLSSLGKHFDTIYLGISKDIPLKLQFGNDENCIIRFYFAPKFED